MKKDINIKTTGNVANVIEYFGVKKKILPKKICMEEKQRRLKWQRLKQ